MYLARGPRALGLLLVAVTAVGCTSAQSSKHSSGPPSVGPPASVGAPLQVSDAVLRAADAPVGTQYVAKGSGAQTLADLVKGDKDAAAETTLLKQAGFRGAYLAIFTGLELSTAAKQGHLVASFAVVFPRPAAAASAMAVLGKTATAAGQTPVAVATTGLGSNARGLRVKLTTFPGDSYVYVWQENNTVRVLIDAGGTGVVTQADSLRLAVRMAAVQQHTTSTAAQAAALVLQPADAPVDAALAKSRSGNRTAAQFAPAKADTTRLRQLGYLAGYTNQYLSEGLAHPTTGGAGQRQSNYIASQAQQYADGTSAQRAYELFAAREAKLFGSQAQRLSTQRLGSDATGFRYVDKKATGDLIGYAYFWRQGSFVLSLFDVGTAGFATPETALNLAIVMQGRGGH